MSTSGKLPPPDPKGSRPVAPTYPPMAAAGAKGRSKVPLIVAGVIGFAIIAALATFAGGSKTKGTASAPSTVPGATLPAGAVAAAETHPVVVTGTALAKLGDAKTADPAVGTKAPALTGYGFDGSPVSIQPGSSPMLVLFVAHWCPHCQREVPLIVKYMADGKIPAGMKVVAVSTGTSSDAPNYPPSAWLAKEKFTAPVLADGKDQEAAAAYGLPGYPYFVVLKADGTVAARGSGEKTTEELDQILATGLK